MNHEHRMQKTHIVLVEFDDVLPAKLVADIRYFGEGNSKNRKMEFDFEYCLDCNHRLLEGKPIVSSGIFDELEKYVTQTRRGSHKKYAEVTVQHSDFDIMDRLIKSALELGKLKQKGFEP
jgi:hypothetical protein